MGKSGPNPAPELRSVSRQLQHEKKVRKRERRAGAREGGKEEEREKERKKGRERGRPPARGFLCEKKTVRFFSQKANENCICLIQRRGT